MEEEDGRMKVLVRKVASENRLFRWFVWCEKCGGAQGWWPYHSLALLGAIHHAKWDHKAKI